MNGEKLYKTLDETHCLCITVTILADRFQLGPIQAEVEYGGNKQGLLEHNFLVSDRELQPFLELPLKYYKMQCFSRKVFPFLYFFSFALTSIFLICIVVAQQVCRLWKDVQNYYVC